MFLPIIYFADDEVIPSPTKLSAKKAEADSNGQSGSGTGQNTGRPTAGPPGQNANGSPPGPNQERIDSPMKENADQ